jgi:hypothetical protein
MISEFPKSAEETKTLAIEVAEHLQSVLADTSDRATWSLKNFQALASFRWNGGPLEMFPPHPDSRKGAFLWDFIAYAPGKGILIAAESEWDRDLKGLQHDFEKLLYVRSPVKVFIFWTVKEMGSSESVVQSLYHYMKDCVDDYSPAEVFILYCRTWEDRAGKNCDHAWILQIDGDPSHKKLGEAQFKKII